MNDDEQAPLKKRIGQLESMVRDLKTLVTKMDRELIAIKHEVTVRPPPSRSKAKPAKEIQDKPSVSKEYENPVPLFYEKENPPEEKQKEMKVRYPALEETQEAPKEEAVPPSPSTEPVGTGETWLSRIGITLLLLGVVFLVKYSIDQGWINPTARLAAGFVVGVVLIQIGLRNRESREAFSQVLQGGGIAVFYIVGFAAYQMYELVPHSVAFVYMVGVTITGVVLSLRQELLSLSMVALLGGLGTPFLIRSGSMNLSGLTAYTCLLLAGTLWVFYQRGWKPLFFTSFLGGWLVHYLSVKGLNILPSNAPDHRVGIQVGLAITWLAFWWVPMLQLMKEEDETPRPVPKDPNSALPIQWSPDVSHLSLSLMANAMLAFFLSTQVWRLHSPDSGWILFGAMFCYAGASRKLYPTETMLGWVNAMMAITMGTLSLAFLLDGDTLIFSLALEATVMHWFAHRLGTRVSRTIAHGLFGFIFLWLAGRLLLEGMEPPAIMNSQALTDLAVLVLISLSAFRLGEDNSRLPYWAMAYFGLMVWWVREISNLPNGDGFVSIAWGVQGAALFIVGLKRNTPVLFKIGFATLVVVALKLLILDLAHLETIWRILLFMGIGAAFLALSYKVRDLLKTAEG